MCKRLGLLGLKGPVKTCLLQGCGCFVQLDLTTPFMLSNVTYTIDKWSKLDA
jgi:hypothetical protein